jgi:hypothetical protein
MHTDALARLGIPVDFQAWHAHYCRDFHALSLCVHMRATFAHTQLTHETLRVFSINEADKKELVVSRGGSRAM